MVAAADVAFAPGVDVYSMQQFAPQSTPNDIFNQTGRMQAQAAYASVPSHVFKTGSDKQPIPSEYGADKSILKEVNSAINRKDTDDLYKYNGSIADFPNRKKKMVDRFADATQRYEAH